VRVNARCERSRDQREFVVLVCYVRSVSADFGLENRRRQAKYEDPKSYDMPPNPVTFTTLWMKWQQADPYVSVQIDFVTLVEESLIVCV